MLLILLAHQNNVVPVLYYQGTGGDEKEDRDALANLEGIDPVSLHKIAWELGFDEFEKGKQVTLSEFTMRAFGETERVNEARNEIRRIVKTIDKKHKYERELKALAISGSIYIIIRYLFMR